MFVLNKRDQRILEIILIVLSIGLSALVYKIDNSKLVVLNLFFLPVVLSAFFLGRYSAGVLAIFCVITTSFVCVLQSDEFTVSSSPLIVGLSVTVWGAILCLTAMLVGTLSDERSTQAVELHEAYVGVIEVLAKYLHGGNPRLNELTTRIVNLSQRIALEMNLSAKRIDDIRVAALMQGFSKIEVTTKVISKALSNLESKPTSDDFSFQGTDLAFSLGSVLRGAIPILVNQDTRLPADLKQQISSEPPIGAKILAVARAYEEAVFSHADYTPSEVIKDLRSAGAVYDEDVLDALERLAVHQPELATAAV